MTTRSFKIEGSELVITADGQTVRLPAGNAPHSRLGHVVRGYLAPGDEAIRKVLDVFEIEAITLPERKSKGDAT